MRRRLLDPIGIPKSKRKIFAYITDYEFVFGWTCLVTLNNIQHALCYSVYVNGLNFSLSVIVI